MGSTFDIFTTLVDGSPFLVESVVCLARAKETALRLSLLCPGVSFAYFERVQASNSAATLPDTDRMDAAVNNYGWLPLPC